MYNEALFQPETELDGDQWFALQTDHLFNDLLPEMKRIWHRENIDGVVQKGAIREFVYERKDVIWAFMNFSDVYGPVINRRKVMFRKCACVDATGRRKPCIPPKTGWMCSRIATLFKSSIILKHHRAHRIWVEGVKFGIADAAKRAEVESKKFLNSVEGTLWVTKLSYERAEEILMERGATRALGWRYALGLTDFLSLTHSH